MNKNIYWSVVIENSICIICWTALAIVFDKWWIALFALLFMSSVKTKPVSYRVCDKCGKHSEYADSKEKALQIAKEAGWVHNESDNTDYCPNCKR